MNLQAQQLNDLDLEVVSDPLSGLSKKLRSMDRQFAIKEATNLAQFVNWGGTAALPIHRWLRYREAYSPQLIDALGLKNRILDPFCGCGSMLLGAAERNLKSVGLDINPIASFAAEVKLRRLSSTQIETASRFCRSFPRSLHRTIPWPTPSLSIAEKVFEPTILETIMKLRTKIEGVEKSDPEVRDFLHLAWLAILETVGSYFKEGNGIKYRNKKRQQGKYANRTEGEWQAKRFGEDQEDFVLRAYRKQLQIMLADTQAWQSGNWSAQKVIRANALDAVSVLKRRRFDSVVFSPPYANRFDYFESLKVELWFGGFVSSYAEAQVLRKSSLRSHLGSDLKRPAREFEKLESLIKHMDKSASSWRMGVPSLLRGYFDDMFSVLQQCRILAPKGTCHVVVGNSAFAGVIFPTDTLVAELGRLAGFDHAEILVARHLTVAPQQRAMLTGLEQHMRESVVVLR